MLEFEDESSEKSWITTVLKKHVSFAIEATIIHVIERVPEELRDVIWYSTEECMFIAWRNKLLIKTFKAGINKESEEHTLRGLEKQFDDHLLRQQRAHAIHVFLQHYRQQRYERGDCCSIPSSIPAAYRLRSQECERDALAAGTRDAEVVFQLIQRFLNPPLDPPQREETNVVPKQRRSRKRSKNRRRSSKMEPARVEL